MRIRIVLIFVLAALFVSPATGGSAFLPATSYVLSDVRKVCQLTGEFDRQLQQYTLNRTESRYGVRGTDLGASLEHKGRIYFLFGDTIGTNYQREGHGREDHGREGHRREDHRREGHRKITGNDSIAYTSDMNPSDCLNISFVTDDTGKYLSPEVPGISLLNFEVPVGGFSDDDSIYVYFNTRAQEEGAKEEEITRRSVLTKTHDMKKFVPLYEFSREKFWNVAPVVINNSDILGLPEMTGRGVLLWGSGTYRASNPYLAYMPLESVENKESIRFFAGLSSGIPVWSEKEQDAVELFNQPCIGELSVAWNPFIKKWIMLYNCKTPRGINFRTSDSPWGPWSEPAVLFDPWKDKGYCEFMHVNWKFKKCDYVHDPGKQNVWGGEYGPYMIPRFFSGNENETTIYFLMSTWNPYNVMLMEGTIRKY